MHSERFPPNKEDLLLSCLVKGPERYIFLYNESGANDTMRTIRKYELDPDLSFNGDDYETIFQEVRANVHNAVDPVIEELEIRNELKKQMPDRFSDSTSL